MTWTSSRVDEYIRFNASKETPWQSLLQEVKEPPDTLACLKAVLQVLDEKRAAALKQQTRKKRRLDITEEEGEENKPVLNGVTGVSGSGVGGVSLPVISGAGLTQYHMLLRFVVWACQVFGEETSQQEASIPIEFAFLAKICERTLLCERTLPLSKLSLILRGFVVTVLDHYCHLENLLTNHSVFKEIANKVEFEIVHILQLQVTPQLYLKKMSLKRINDLTKLDKHTAISAVQMTFASVVDLHRKYLNMVESMISRLTALEHVEPSNLAQMMTEIIPIEAGDARTGNGDTRTGHGDTRNGDGRSEYVGDSVKKEWMVMQGHCYIDQDIARLIEDHELTFLFSRSQHKLTSLALNWSHAEKIVGSKVEQLINYEAQLRQRAAEMAAKEIENERVWRERLRKSGEVIDRLIAITETTQRLRMRYNPFKVLDINPVTATASSIRKVRQKLSLMIHPDKLPPTDRLNPNERDVFISRANDAFKILNEAYEKALTAVQEGKAVFYPAT